MNKNYRQFYKDHYGICFNSNYEVHHLDLNHKNNNIDNLLLLPKKLHKKYHFLTSSINDFQISLSTKIHGNAIQSDCYNREIVRKLIDVMYECDKWYDYKLFLEGILPNVHGIKLGDKNE